jgi:hypothetical protein
MGGFLGGRLGGLAGVFRGVLGPLAGVAGLLALVRSRLANANAIGDLSETLEIPVRDIIALKQASLRSGVREQTGTMALSRLGVIRAEALQDPKQAALFRRFGIGAGALASPAVSSFDIATRIAATRGQRGAQPGDARDLSRLFGYNYLKVLQLFRAIGEVPKDLIRNLEETNRNLDRADKQVTEAKEKLGSFWDRVLVSLMSPWVPIKAKIKRKSAKLPTDSPLEVDDFKLERIPEPLSTATSLPAADALARIGGYRGAAAGVGQTLAEYRRLLTSINQGIQRIDHHLGSDL